MQAASRILFLVAGLLWLVIGMLTPVMSDTAIGRRTLFVSPAADTELFGNRPEELLVSNSQLATLRYVILRVIAGLLVATGLLTAGVAWFGLREPDAWALALLTVVGLVVLPYWWISFGPYRESHIRIGLFDIPPFMWVPGILMPVAAALGWLSRG